MKPDKAKQLLEQALRALPPDYAFRNVRTHLAKAIREITEVEQKRSRKEGSSTPAQQWKLDLETGMLKNPMSEIAQKQAVELIDKMIDAEMKKIEEIKQQKKSGNDQQLLG